MLRKILPHVSILFANMYLVFFLIDKVNSAMAFINNDLTKALVAVLSVLTIVNAVFLIRDQNRRTDLAAQKAAHKKRRRAEGGKR